MTNSRRNTSIHNKKQIPLVEMVHIGDILVVGVNRFAFIVFYNNILYIYMCIHYIYC